MAGDICSVWCGVHCEVRSAEVVKLSALADDLDHFANGMMNYWGIEKVQCFFKGGSSSNPSDALRSIDANYDVNGIGAAAIIRYYKTRPFGIGTRKFHFNQSGCFCLNGFILTSPLAA